MRDRFRDVALDKEQIAGYPTATTAHLELSQDGRMAKLRQRVQFPKGSRATTWIGRTLDLQTALIHAIANGGDNPALYHLTLHDATRVITLHQDGRRTTHHHPQVEIRISITLMNTLLNTLSPHLPSA